MRTEALASRRLRVEDVCMSAMPLEEIRKLPVEERLRLVEDIWESIRSEGAALTLTRAQREELERRLAAHRADPARGDDLAAVLARIRSKD